MKFVEFLVVAGRRRVAVAWEWHAEVMKAAKRVVREAGMKVARREERAFELCACRVGRDPRGYSEEGERKREEWSFVGGVLQFQVLCWVDIFEEASLVLSRSLSHHCCPKRHARCLGTCDPRASVRTRSWSSFEHCLQ